MRRAIRALVSGLILVGSFSAIAAPVETFTPPQYIISVDDQNKSLVSIAVPLATLEVSAITGINSSLSGQQFNPRLMALRFQNFSEGSRSFELYVDLDTDVARCEVWARFAIPAAKPQDIIVQDIGSDANCRSSLPPVLNLPTRLQVAILDGVRSSLGKTLLGDSAISDWIKEDPLWATLMVKAIAQGAYCTKRALQAFCINIAWLKRSELTEWASLLKQGTPVSQGPADQNAAATKLSEFVSYAKTKTFKPSTKFPGYQYPAPYKHGSATFVDDDMGIFGGLLCVAGIQEGCTLVARAQGPSGRFWRAPDQVDYIDKDYSSFSGDQFNGIAAYLWLANDQQKFEAYLKYILGARQLLPSASRSIYASYKSCQDDKAFQCVLSGPEWTWLNALARKYSLSSSIPSTESNPAAFFGFDAQAMYWQATLAPAGYRLHLTGVQVLLARMMNMGSPAFDEVAKLLAGRQPDNPFFQYLVLGKDARVAATLSTQCPDPATRTEYADWGWQRAATTTAWRDSMIWDCAFMYGLLAK